MTSPTTTRRTKDLRTEPRGADREMGRLMAERRQPYLGADRRPAEGAAYIRGFPGGESREEKSSGGVAWVEVSQGPGGS